MSSPNPFGSPVSGSLHTPPLQVGGTTPLYGTIPPLSRVLYHRGRARLYLNPYSWQHAFMTGHFGTPTVPLTPELSTPGLNGLAGTPSPVQLHQAPIQVVPRILSSPADVPESMPLESLSWPQPSEDPDDISSVESSSPKAMETPAADSGATTGDEETALDEAATTPNRTRRAQPFPLSLLNQIETISVSPPGYYVTQPAELDHHRFSPYNLRKRNRAVRHEVQVQAGAAALPFDDFVLRRAGIKMFNPAIPAPSDIDLLYDCGSSTGRGITIAQFGKIFKCCMDCNHYIFAPRSNKGHDCNGPAVDVKAADFRLTEYFFVDRYLGLTEDDFKSILGVCDTCLRVHLAQWSDWHKCPPGDDPDFVEV